ncbi:unnamed protein product [Ostreobium quekettii]|uniref:RNase H type-1 domain-containing protein n=1 Tax=Ostreobium quekettii TaxID=121088 RepID=A0A8S1IXX3_9CHLO|nr:unnamed protein product [Ostreobium quekettii]
MSSRVLVSRTPTRPMTETEVGQAGTSIQRGVRGGEGRLLSFLQLNCRRSETTWALTHQEIVDKGSAVDVLLIQDPPRSVALGRTGLPGFRLVVARGTDSTHPLAAILLRDSMRFKTVQPFGPRIAAAELLGPSGSTVIVSAYIRHTWGEGLEELRRAVVWAQSRSPRMVLGMDANGHSPFWGPEDVRTNAVGQAVEELIMLHNLEVINDPDAPPSFVSDRGDKSWIDVTLATRSAASGLADWRVDQDFFSGSDHRAIRFSVAHSPISNRVYRCKDWSGVDWPQFSAAVARECRARGVQRASDHDGSTDARSSSREEIREEADRLTTILTEVLQGAIEEHVPEKRVCWASKPWWSPHLTELRRRMKHLRNRADRLDTDHDRGLYCRACKEFTREVKKRILKPRRRIQVADLQTDEEQWAVEDSDKASVLQARFFPRAPSSQEFRDRTATRRAEIDAWLATEWGDFPLIQESEVRRRILEMRAVSAPGADGILAKCLQECSDSITPVLQAIFNGLIRSDDVLIWDIVSSTEGTPGRVQAALDFIADWSEEWGLIFDAAKCKALDVTLRRRVEPIHLTMGGRTIPKVDEIKYLGVWIDSRLTWRKHLEVTCNACLQRLRVIRKLCATHWGLHPTVVSTLVGATVFPRLWYGAVAWGSVVRTQARLDMLDRVLWMSAIITLGLLRTTSTVKAIAACGWLPADLHIRYVILQFVLRQRVYGRTSLGIEDDDGGCSRTPRCSTAALARRELRALRRAHPQVVEGLERVDRACFWIRPPWEAPPQIPCDFLARDEAQDRIDSCMEAGGGVCIFTDGSVMEGGGNGAAAVFFRDDHDELPATHPSHTLLLPMGPLLASTDTEVGGIQGALRQLQSTPSPGSATLITDSQAALLALTGSHWRRCRESVWTTLALHQALWEAGMQVRFWWAPGHSGVAGNELADSAARRAAQGDSPSPLVDTWCNKRQLEREICRWYQDTARRQERTLDGTVLDSTEDVVFRSHLRWTRALPSRYAVALVAQFLTGHYPTRVYLARFRLTDSPFCDECGCPDSRAHLLLDCTRFSYLRESLTSWLREEWSGRTRQAGEACPGWEWDFLTGSSWGRLWLSRFLCETRRRHRRWDDLEATLHREQEGRAALGRAGAVDVDAEEDEDSSEDEDVEEA